jgi:hypothetical protein
VNGEVREHTALGVGCNLLGALVVAALVLCASASAAERHPLVASFGPDGTAASSFEQAGALGIDETTEEVYVADTLAGTIDKFNAAHEPALFSGIDPRIKAGKLTGFSFTAGETELAVNSSTHDFYVVNDGTHTVQAFQASGEPANFTAGAAKGTNELANLETEPCGVAVDSTGDIYVSVFQSGVHVFAPSGEPITTFSKARSTCQVAVDSHGTLYTNEFEGHGAASGGFGVIKYTPSEFPAKSSTTYTEASEAADSNGGWDVAVEPGTNDLYVDQHGQVVEHSEAGGLLGTSFGVLAASESVAVNGATHQVYVSDAKGAHRVQIFGPLVAVPTVTTGAATEVQPHTAGLAGEVNPEGLEVKECYFEYGETTSYGQKASCAEPSAEELGKGSTPVAVHARISELQAGTTYHFRLVASTAQAAELGNDATFATQPPPAIDETLIENLSASAVELDARINPGGLATSYHFEYGTSTAYGTVVSGAVIPPGTSEVTVAPARVTGLSKNTTYHWRIIATSAAGTTTGLDNTFIYPTGGSGLSDSRAYEMVTPTHKNGALIGSIFQGLEPDIAEDGSRIVLTTVQCFEEGSCPVDRGTVGTSYAFTRTATEWQASSLAPAANEYSINSVWAVNANNVQGQVGAARGLFSMPTGSGGNDEFYVGSKQAGFMRVGPVTSPTFGTQGIGERAGGLTKAATADFSRFVYLEAKSQWPFDETFNPSLSESSSLYEYSNPAATPSLVGVEGPAGSTNLVSRCQTTLGGLNAVNPGVAHEALSEDGRYIYFTALKCPGAMNKGVPVPANELWVRINEEESVQLSARSSTECTGLCAGSEPGAAEFEGASADGKKAFFVDRQQLTNAANQSSHPEEVQPKCGQGLGSGCNLYEWELASTGSQLTTVSAGDSSGGGPRVQGVVAVSQSGARVYFVAQGVLTKQTNATGEAAQKGADNLYVYERDAVHPTGILAFVTALSPGDAEEWGELGGTEASASDIANVTADGASLVFTSHRALTSDDTRGASGPAQVFGYDAETGTLTRLSVGEHGFNDNGNTGAGDANIVPGTALLASAGSGTRNPTMTNDGSAVFFMSPIGLTTNALNDVPIGEGPHGAEYAQNIYEYRNGEVFLISDGHDVGVERVTACQHSISDVCLVGASGSGRDVFFTTSDQLVSSDTDTQLDYYDARICSTEDPCVSTTTSSPSPCKGEECRGAPAQAPEAPTPSTATFNGPGNQAPVVGTPPPKKPSPCRRGLVRKHRRCVKVKHSRSAKAKRTHGHARRTRGKRR